MEVEACQRERRQRFHRGPCLASLRPEEFPAGRRVEEQLPYGDGGTGLARDELRPLRLPAIDGQPSPIPGA